jgi:hypothetical protein
VLVMLLRSVHECARTDACWICGEELKRKEKRIFMLCQLETAFTAAYASSVDPRRTAFTDSVTEAPNLYEWWSSFISVEGNKKQFCERLGHEVDVLSTLVVVCQRSSSSCSNLYAMLTASNDTIQDLDPVRRKIEQDAMQHSSHGKDTSHIYQPQFLGSNTGRSGVRYKPCSIEHWNYVTTNARSMEGWMTKRSHDYFTIFRKWQVRYFVLDIEKKLLSYYKDATKIQHRGTYQLCGHVRAVTTSDGKQLKDNTFYLEVQGRNSQGRMSSLLIYLDTLQTADFWFSCLRYAVRVHCFF